MKFISVCSGIEAASAAWHPLGWQAVAYSEIEPFPSAVLAHHFPGTPNWGDMTKFKEWPNFAIDLLCGGTPCQSFSVAGLRKGLDDPRGNLMLTFGAIAAKYRPQWLVWENVPGVLSSNGGRDFADFLGLITGQHVDVPADGWGNGGMLSGIASAYGGAYRVLDAQYFGVAQRRRRVFVVGHLGDWRRAAAVLFERHSLSGHPAPSRQARQSTATDVAPSLVASGRGVERTGETRGQDPVVAVAHIDTMPALRAGASNGGAGHGARSGDSKDELIVPVRILCVATGQAGAEIGADMAPTLNCNHEAPYVAGAMCKDVYSGGMGGRVDAAVQGYALPVAAFTGGQGSAAGGIGYDEHVAPTLSSADSGSNRTPALMNGMQVRRLTPKECESLQGFPDGWTDVPHRGKPAADGPRYKAIGNSWAVPCARWIGERIDAVSKLELS